MKLREYPQFAPLVLRIVLGITFLIHGILKFSSIEQTIQGFTQMGMPLPGIAGPLVALVEVIGGLALILGIGTQLFALLLAIVMLVAIVFVKGGSGFVGGFEYELALLAGLVALILSGPGVWALAVERKMLKGAQA